MYGIILPASHNSTHVTRKGTSVEKKASQKHQSLEKSSNSNLHIATKEKEMNQSSSECNLKC